MPKVDTTPEPVGGDLVALDTETTGLDLWHGAQPFFVTTCQLDGRQRFWEWDVDPLTRKVSVPEDDRREVAALVGPLGPPLVLQNGKFDCHALETIGCAFHWSRVDDTLIAGHLLHSGQPHDLTSMALMMLGVDIQPFEDALEDACNQARSLARRRYPHFRIAKADLPEMPSAKSGSKRTKRGAESESPWKMDAWLPRVMAREQGLEADHPWWTVLRDYANKDSETTLRLWLAQREEVKRRGLWEVYQERLKILPIVAEMEQRGVTVLKDKLADLQDAWTAESRRLGDALMALAKAMGHDLELPKGASVNGSLRTFCFDVLKLEPIRGIKAKTDAPTLDKGAMDHYRRTLDPEKTAGRFISILLGKRKLDTSIGYADGYRRYGINGKPGVLTLHPSANPTGTVGLRFSMSNPNGQNVSTQEDEDGEGMRHAFGPAPGREWWSMDYSNLELRIPAHEAGEQVMIDLFEHEDEPPYFGSYHLLVAHKLFPKEFEEASRLPDGTLDGRLFKASRKQLYKVVKNTDLASQYGAQKATTDRTAHREGAFEVIQGTFSKTFALAAKYVRHAEQHGFVETIPDRDVGRGYPVECQRSEWGKVSPTVPFNYHVQSTAGQCINKAMTRCWPVLKDWERQSGKPHFIALQVHDELVFDLPAGGKRNLPKARRLKSLMEASGEDIGVPLKVSMSWHPENWGKAEEV